MGRPGGTEASGAPDVPDTSGTGVGGDPDRLDAPGPWEGGGPDRLGGSGPRGRSGAGLRGRVWPGLADRFGLYAAVAARGFRRFATYRVATVAGVFTNTVFGLIISYSYIALWDQRPHLGGYTEAQALTYVWIGQALLASMSQMGSGFEQELIERISSGAIAIDLYRPVDLQGWWMASDLGRAGYQLLGRGIVPSLCGALLFPLAIPHSPVPWLLFAVSVALGLQVSFAIRYLVALSAFWLMDGVGLTQIASVVGLFLSGMLLPLNAFPGTLAETAQALPWSAMLQTPADVLLGRRHGTGALAVLALQAGWAVVLLALGRLLQGAATRRVVVQGG